MTCGDRQACVQPKNGYGVCSVYCELNNPDRGCTPGYTCTETTVGGAANPPKVHTCLPTVDDGGIFDTGAPMMDDGGDGGDGALPDVSPPNPDGGSM